MPVSIPSPKGANYAKHMWSDRRERNLRYVRTYSIVLEEGEQLLRFALFEDDVTCHTHTDG